MYLYRNSKYDDISSQIRRSEKYFKRPKYHLVVLKIPQPNYS